MAFQLSPGVNVSEIDLTTVVPSVATSIGAFAGDFAWGPVEEVVTISNEVRLVDVFGKPNNDNYEYWFSAANFLAYSNNLKVVRVSALGARNAAANTVGTTANTVPVGVLIKNEGDYVDNWSAGGVQIAANTKAQFAAKYAGVLGNSLRIEIADRATYSNTWTWSSLFTDTPTTSSYTSTLGGANDEIHIVVLDNNGRFSGTANSVLEVFPFVSKAADAKNSDGSSNYYKNVLNSRSKYVWWLDHPSTANGNWGNTASNTTFSTLSSVYRATFVGGVDGTVSSANLIAGYDQVSNPDSVDVSLIITGPANTTVDNHVITNIAEVRKDCLVFVSPDKSDVVDNYNGEETSVLNKRNNITSSSYAVMDSGWKYQYDKYNDVYRWVPLNADVAGVCARTDLERDPWFSPAGSNRGIIKNVVKLAWNPTKASRDDLYVKGINPVVTFQGEGTILFGDKTLLTRPSAFDRINVRRLFIVLEKAISRAARSSLFEFNDQFTRAQFVALVEPYLRDVQGRRGITDFRVVCDETNNTPEVIDRNEFVGDIYIKPARSINFIQLNFVAVRTGVNFDEIVGSFRAQ